MNNNILIITVLTGLLLACAATVVDASSAPRIAVELFTR
jgi:hypothetical protein